MKSLVAFAIVVLAPFYYRAQIFTDYALANGINHSVNTNLLFGGTGVCFFDYNKDGWDDITFLQENDSIRFFLNQNGVLVEQVSYIDGPNELRQLLWVDYDNDDDYDIFITATNGKVKLFQNDGNFNFSDESINAGLSPFNTNNYGISFADYDRDGNLDFYLARYMLSGNVNDPTQTNALYHNNGDGTFTNLALSAGVADSIQPSFEGVWIDVNKDLWPDLYVINDRLLWGNTMYLNNGDGTFTDITTTCGAEMFAEDPMGVTFEDFDNDFDIDILCSNGGPPTKPIRVFENLGLNQFAEIGASTGIAVNVTHHCTWGATWFDADNDSYKDLYITTGLLTMSTTDEIRSYLFMNDGQNQFADSPSAFQTNHIAASYAVAKGDLDKNGYADLVVQNAKNTKSFIWKNKTDMQVSNYYIKLSLQGVVSNRMGVGAWVEVYTDQGNYTHYTRCGENFVSQNSQHFIFGLGDSDKVDSVIVYYPSGIIDTYYDLISNGSYLLVEGETLTNQLTYSGSLLFCAGDSVVLDGGDYPSHMWNTGDTTRYLTVYNSGQYYVTTNFFGLNIQSNTLVVNVYSSPTIQYQLTHPTCHDQSNGQVDLIVQTQAPGSTIFWSNGYTGTNNSNLPAGTYTYVYSDLAGCEYADTFALISPTAISVFHQVVDNGGDFSLNLIVTGGVGPYTILLNGDSAGLSNSGLGAGIYLVQIIDQNNCSIEMELNIGSLSLDENKFEVNVFPNPSVSGIFEVQTDFVPDDIQLIDQSGKTVPFEFENAKLSMEQISGTYYLYIFKGNRFHKHKLLIL